MNFQSAKKKSSVTLMLQAACLYGLATSAVVRASEACESQECHELVAAIKANMDSSVDPCEDFFQHACGNFIRNNPTPMNLSTYSTMTSYGAQIKAKLYNLLEEPESQDDSRSVKAIKRQYKTCKDENALEAVGLDTLLDVINQNGGWPMIVPDVFPYRKSVLEVQDEYNRRTGNGPLYTILILSRTLFSAENAITLDQPHAFPKNKYSVSDPGNASKFVNYITDVAREFAKASNVVIPANRLRKDAQDIFDFAVKLWGLRDLAEFRDRGLSMKIKEAQTTITNGTTSPFDLLTVLQRTFGRISGVTLTKDEVINVRELEYMQGLVDLLVKTSPIAVLNYMHFHFVENYRNITTSSMRQLADEVYQTQSNNRIVECASLPNVQIALGRMFVKRYVPESKIAAAESVLNAMKKEVEVQVERTAFIDEKSKPNALAKVNNLVSFIGYTDLFATDQAVDEYYSKFQLSDNVLKNVLNYDEVKYRKLLEKLRVPINHTALREYYGMSPIGDAGIYSASYNRLGLPGALLQASLFSEDYPTLSNFARFGQVIGGILADLYIFLGTQFDDQGNVIPWSTDATFEEFEKRDKCFIDQYSNYIIKELAENSLSYNMSTFSFRPILARYHFGLKASYHAYHKSVPRGTEFGSASQRLGMSEPVEKQFFLSYANLFCESANPSKLLKKFDEEIPHNPLGRVKVNSAVANLPEFSEVYGCALGTPMNPLEKCSTLD